MKRVLPITCVDQVPVASLAAFFVMTFGIAWGVLALFIFLPGLMVAYFGELTGQHPLFYLAVYAPAIAAFVLVSRYSGAAGLRRYLGRFLLWSCPPAWMLFLLAGIPLLFVGGSLLKGNLVTEPWPLVSPQSLVAMLFFALIKGPVEEFGWRGFALPLLQRRLAPFWASLVLGAVWAFWHTPAFLLSGTQQSAWSFMPFLAGTIAISVLMTPFFNATRGSIGLAALMHFQVMNPLWPDAQPYDSLFFVAAASLVVWLNRSTLFTRTGAITQVVPVAAGQIPASRQPGEVREIPGSRH
jgi:membrane protease YdiL (CAAX protease family)